MVSSMRSMHRSLATPLRIRREGIGRGLVGAWIPAFGHTGGMVPNLAGSTNDGTLNDYTLSSAWVPTPEGWAINNTGSEHIACGTIEMYGWKGCTIIVRCTYDSGGTQEHVLANNWIAGSNPMVLFRLEPTNDTVECFCKTGASATQRGGTMSGLSVPVDTPFHIAFVFDQNDGLTAYLDGLRSTSTFSSSGEPLATTGASGAFQIGEQTAGFDFHTGHMYGVQLWDRALGPSEILEDFTTPWAAFELEDVPIFEDAAAPTGRIMSSLVGAGGLAGTGGIAGQGGGLAA